MTREPLLTSLARNMLAAALLGALLLIALPRRGALGWDYFDTFIVAFCFTFLGYLVEVLLLQLPEIESGAGRLVRVAGWFGGGLWCYLVARFLWVQFARDLNDLPPLVWGGVFFVGLELVLHAALNAAGRPNFYRPSPMP